MHCHVHKYYNGRLLVCHELASLPSIRITFEICLFTATLTDKNNPSSDALLFDNLLNSQETFVEGQRVCF